MKRYLLSICLIFSLCSINQLSAQNITGTWEGQTRREFFQLNLSQSGTEICGYTYDHSVSNLNDFCKAYYIGKYEDGFLMLNGTGFIAKSYNHVLMRIGLRIRVEKGELFLEGRILTGAYDFEGLAQGQYIKMRRVSKSPNRVPGTNSACYTPKSKVLDDFDEGTDPDVVDDTPAPTYKPPVVKSTPKPTPTPKPAQKPPVVVKPAPKPTVKPAPKQVPAPIVKNTKPEQAKVTLREPDALPAIIAERKKVEQGRITVNVKDITLKLYDNGVVDGDTVTVFYNGKMIVNKQRLTTNPIEVKIRLEDNVSKHEIVLFADNLGSISPNTALIVVTAGKKRYELRSSADLSKNAVLVFEYEPDE